MKNIHILPTDKPSRLFITDNKLFNYHKPQQGDGVKIINQNIYITSDEEIKEGDWVIYTNGIVHCQKMDYKEDLSNVEEFNAKKIILTTDQDLIKDGVQAIDDEFLEWFVKNPSCEEVEIINAWGYNNNWFGMVYFSDYKIIIPKEEPKQERMYSEEEVKKLIELHSDFIDSKIDYEGINNATTAISNPEWNDEEWFEQFKKK